MTRPYLTGYPAEMEALIDSNSGLRSRFSRRVVFAAYSGAELFAIADSMIEGRGYALADDAAAALEQAITGLHADFAAESGWGNAREVRQLVDRLVRSLASRTSDFVEPTDEAWRRSGWASARRARSATARARSGCCCWSTTSTRPRRSSRPSSRARGP